MNIRIVKLISKIENYLYKKGYLNFIGITISPIVVHGLYKKCLPIVIGCVLRIAGSSN